MTPSFSVRTTARFDRLLKALARRHSELVERYAEALEILGTDPYNRSRRHDMLKLQGAVLVAEVFDQATDDVQGHLPIQRPQLLLGGAFQLAHRLHGGFDLIFQGLAPSL
jgi:hypothetical protein